MKYDQAIIDKARTMWLKGHHIADIAKTLKLGSSRVVYQWRDRYEWSVLKPPEPPVIKVSRAINLLMDKPEKTRGDWQELDKLARLLFNLEKANAIKKHGLAAPEKRNKQGEAKPKRKKKNDVSEITAEDFEKFEAEILYPHQRIWIKAGLDPLTQRSRFILKSRQIGATFTFAYEAFKTAVLEQHNQIFISSTKAQAEVFKSFIAVIARAHFDTELMGNPIKLSNHAELHFLSPNSFADSRSGDVYFDEVFKTKSFKRMEEIAAPMATLKDFKKTYFSSPTAISHEAYDIWSGERYTKVHKNTPKIKVDDLDELQNGRLDPDGIWRCACTIHHAIKTGWDKVDLKQLRQETPDKRLFAVVYEAQFIDDSLSVFSLNEILACGVDTSEWTDFNPNDDMPFGIKPVAIGYDPAGIGDNACAVTLAKPAGVEEKFRLLRKDVWRHVSAPDQCDQLKELTQRYQVEHFEIDSTGPGIFVGDFIEQFFPLVKRITYTPAYKAMMVQKAQALIKSHRFEYDENDTNLPLAFLTVKQMTTKQGQITYGSDHSNHKLIGHGDEAWATMHAMMSETMVPEHVRNITVEVYE